METQTNKLGDWMHRYLENAVRDVRSPGVAKKIALHLHRFLEFYQDAYGHDLITAWVQRDVREWRKQLRQQFAPSTVNNHMASLSGFATWVYSIDKTILPGGHPVKGLGEMPLPPLEPRTLTDKQVNSLKNLCERLTQFYRLKGRTWAKVSDEAPLHKYTRPFRDRAIVYVLLSAGLRREELVKIDLVQLQPNEPYKLKRARKARLLGVRGKGKTERTVFLSSDARIALADYIEEERPQDSSEQTEALFLSAVGLPARKADGRLSPRSINTILKQIGRWHDAEQDDPERHVSPLRPHDLRHTFAFRLAKVTGADAYELERRLGHRSQRYIHRYTNPPEHIAAGYIEEF